MIYTKIHIDRMKRRDLHKTRMFTIKKGKLFPYHKDIQCHIAIISLACCCSDNIFTIVLSVLYYSIRISYCNNLLFVYKFKKFANNTFFQIILCVVPLIKIDFMLYVILRYGIYLFSRNSNNNVVEINHLNYMNRIK